MVKTHKKMIVIDGKYFPYFLERTAKEVVNKNLVIYDNYQIKEKNSIWCGYEVNVFLKRKEDILTMGIHLGEAFIVEVRFDANEIYSVCIHLALLDYNKEIPQKLIEDLIDHSFKLMFIALKIGMKSDTIDKDIEGYTMFLCKP